ncbi:hypothetical protein KIPB_011408, partial [Kipferlia bialata]
DNDSKKAEKLATMNTTFRDVSRGFERDTAQKGRYIPPSIKAEANKERDEAIAAVQALDDGESSSED